RGGGPRATLADLRPAHRGRPLAQRLLRGARGRGRKGGVTATHGRRAPGRFRPTRKEIPSMARKSKRARNGADQAPIVIHPATNIPLDRLFLSDANVRTVGADDPEAIAALAHSISGRSLLQSLMVRPRGEEPDTYEVPGGGRRLRALKKL